MLHCYWEDILGARQASLTWPADTKSRMSSYTAFIDIVWAGKHSVKITKKHTSLCELQSLFYRSSGPLHLPTLDVYIFNNA